MNILGKIAEKISLAFNFISKGNKKVSQKNAIAPVSMEGTGNSVFNVATLNVLQISDVTRLASHTAPENMQDLIRDASKLFLAERAMKQIGFNETVSRARLDEIESPAQIDRGWFLRWMDVAQNTSTEDVQEMVAATLRGQFQAPQAFSLRTLDVLKNLNQQELQIFKIFCNSVFRSGSFGQDSVITEPFGGNPGSNSMQAIGLNYTNLTTLVNAGLIHSEIAGANRTIATSQIFLMPFTIGNKQFRLQRTKPVEADENKDIQVGILRLTQAGLELSRVMPEGTNDVYNAKFLEWISGKWDYVPIN